MFNDNEDTLNNFDHQKLTELLQNKKVNNNQKEEPLPDHSVDFLKVLVNRKKQLDKSN